jgi:hypothetical protein
MDEEASSEAIASSVFGLEEMPSNFRGKNATQEALRKSKQTTHATANSMLQAMNCGVDTQVEPAFMHTLNTNPDLPTMIYYTRRYAHKQLHLVYVHVCMHCCCMSCQSGYY